MRELPEAASVSLRRERRAQMGGRRPFAYSERQRPKVAYAVPRSRSESAEDELFPISSLELNFGSPRGGPLTIPDPAITVFVGPNNSGKSMLLRELGYALRTHGHGQQILKVVTCPDFTGPLADQILDRVLREAHVSASIPENEGFQLRSGRSTHQLTKKELRERLRSPLSSGQDLMPLLLRTISLDGSARLQLAGERQIESLERPSSSLERLLVDDESRSRLRRVLFEAFGKYLVIDAALHPGRAMLKYSDREPAAHLERSFAKESIEFFRSCTSIDAMSDGVRAFTGILFELVAGDPSVVLIDEPEAFLHPSLAFLLGREICRPLPAGAQKNVFIATHSSSFLMGCIQSGAPVNIVRLTHSGKESTARLLDAASLRSLLRNPLLRSVGAIEAIFYGSVVVTEADADRAFYDEINQRLVMSGDSRGIPNCLFLRAQNKQTVPDIMRPLRALGIPVAGIVDVDVYEEGGKVWTNLVEGAGMDSTTATGTATVRSHLKKAFDASGVAKPKRNGGINVLSGADQQAANNLFDQLEDHGVFVVRHGEVEHWLPGHAASGLHGPDWLVDIFQRMGEDPLGSAYLQPGNGDVWDFVGSIGRWLKNPNRKGVPG